MKTIVPTYCHYSEIDQLFFESLFAFFAFDKLNRNIVRGCVPVRGLYIDDNRNAAVRRFLETQGDYALVLDTDIDFGQEVPYQLLDLAESKGLPIVTGMYFTFCQDGELRPVWCPVFDPIDGGLFMYDDLPTEQVVPLEAAGMGCCLIRRDVFETMAKHPVYGKEHWTWFGRDETIYKGEPSRWGEDISFCLRAKKLGFQTWGAREVQVNHWKKTRLGAELYDKLYGRVEKTYIAYKGANE